MEKKHNLFKLNCFVSFLLLHSSFFLYHLLLHLSSSSLHFSPFVLSSLSLLSHQSPEPKGSDSQPTPVTNRELLGSHLTADRLGGSVQVLGNGLNTVFILSFPFSLVLFFPHSFFFSVVSFAQGLCSARFFQSARFHTSLWTRPLMSYSLKPYSITPNRPIKSLWP